MSICTGIAIAALCVLKTEIKTSETDGDTGRDKRTVVSGIAVYYELEKVIGQQVSILINMELRKTKGIESLGLILMAEGAATCKLVFVQPKEVTNEGGRISG